MTFYVEGCSRMKFFIVLMLLSNLHFVFGDCPDCDGQSSFYNAIGCAVLCRRKSCPTNYNCRNVLEKYKAEKKCYFDGKYYDVNTTLPEKYPTRDGSGMCNYQCNYSPDPEGYFLTEVDCESNPNVPTTEQCNKMLQIQAIFVLQFNTAITYTPDVCKLGIIIAFNMPPTNCGGRKCCKFLDRSYKRGTVFRVFNNLCYCLCPPVMICR
ncbi:hypothetical protein RN001_013076 [Aquatica leii]|uniref:Uncharacterized protein n=1 Tax=Aquatica leii TaxID=1421715 RepID=A0AAN7P1T7_9COLE|nr:hypothetical protein RN001_013076 [Aquatica leii]